MYFTKPTDGYHFSCDNIKKLEEHYSGTYVGAFCTRKPSGNWNDIPVDVFYQSNPDVSKGHSHYFGVFRQDGHVYVTNAISVTEQPMMGVVADDGEIVVSRYRHDYRVSGDGSVFIDGGRDYTRYGWANSINSGDSVLPRLIRVKIEGSELVAV